MAEDLRRQVALEIDKLVQLHFLPVHQPDVGVVRIHTAEGHGRIAHGLQLHTRHRPALLIENVDACRQANPARSAKVSIIQRSPFRR